MSRQDQAGQRPNCLFLELFDKLDGLKNKFGF